MTERFRAVPAVYIIMRRKDGKILLIRRFNTGYRDGWYGLPAGHLEGNEPAERAVVREAKEEVGVKIDPKDVRMRHVMHRRAEEGGHERIDFCFETDQWKGEARNAEPHKCDDLIWCDPVSLPKNTVPTVRHMLGQIAKGEVYSSLNF